MMLVPLAAADGAETSAAVVGGKASSLARLYGIPSLRRNAPKSYALSTSFFQPWVDAVVSGGDYDRTIRGIEGNCRSAADQDEELVARAWCDGLKQKCLSIPLGDAQRRTLDELSSIVASEFSHGLAAVRSSAVEEDGGDFSYAGMFETELGVTPSGLERAVRRCFASKFDFRVLSYAATRGGADDRAAGAGVDANAIGGFALVVMEMIDSAVAGVAFSANPLNSDRDECVVDSSYGLGESVVDGSVTADRFVYDKLRGELVSQTIGKKTVERRLKLVKGGGVDTLTIDDERRQNASSLSEMQLEEMVRATCIVEKEYGVPVDVEWAYAEDLELVLLQARPITTLFWMDESMMTEPGEKRVLYYDFNIASEATTTTPFRHMDMSLYCRMTNVMMGMSEDTHLFKYDPKMPIFNASTRQYLNMSIFFKYLSTENCAKEAILLDPYLSSLFASKDCDRDRYHMKKLPKGVNLKNLWWLFRQAPIMEYYKISRRFKKDPEGMKEKYLRIVESDFSKLKACDLRGPTNGLHEYSSELFQCLIPSLNQEMGLLTSALPLWKELDKKRREGKSDQIRSEFDALCSGYEGDELMKININIYRLANLLDDSIWEQYGHDELHLLDERIRQNLDGTIVDLPSDFLSEWTQFIKRYGWDGEDQMFISSPRYQDDPVLLLKRLCQNVGSGINNPALGHKEQATKRRHVMKLHEDRLTSMKFTNPFKLSRIQTRNSMLEHLMWIRNSPKMHIAAVFGVLRTHILRVEEKFLDSKRLDEKDDIFHLDLEEVDRALADESYDLMAIARPRKAIHERALCATECPLLIDSRCRILRPDRPSQKDAEEGTVIGAPISPGAATGRVRLMKSPTDYFESGEVLAATVTSPAWTPLFVGASAVILQIGGALQHGALCAREFGKPAVSGIDIHNVLKTGMLVTVDGNVGTVKITDESKI